MAGPDLEALDGGAWRSHLEVLEFDSYDQSRAWYDSREYAGPKALRQETSTGRVILVDGYDQPTTG